MDKENKKDTQDPPPAPALSEGMINFLLKEGNKSEGKAAIDAARELGIDALTEEEANMAIIIEEQENNSRG